MTLNWATSRKVIRYYIVGKGIVSSIQWYQLFKNRVITAWVITNMYLGVGYSCKINQIFKVLSLR
jgi:hypothetical protein